MKQNLLRRYQSAVLPGPLNGTLVIGFCYYVAGPIALQNLVGHGALVIKIERKPLGDPSRNVFPKAAYNSLTHGQLSVAINYEEENDRQLLQRLLEAADVIVDNRSVRAREEDPLLSAFLKSMYKLSPVIYCSINGFPNATKNRMPGLDASAQAWTGLAYTNCSSPNQPLKVGIPLLDMTTGLLAANYILANLFLLKQGTALPPATKQVISIAVSLAGTSAWFQANQFLEAMLGREYLRTGNQDRYAAPFSYYTAADGLISVATVNEAQFKKFCTHVIEKPEFHDRYPTIQKRIEDQDSFEQELNGILAQHSKEYWLQRCKEHEIPVAPVLKVSEALKLEFVQELIHSTTDGLPIMTSGATNSLFPSTKPTPAPTLGQHTEEIRTTMSTRVSKL